MNERIQELTMQANDETGNLLTNSGTGNAGQ